MHDLDRATIMQVAEAVRVGPGQMPQFGEQQLTQTDLNDVASYVMRLMTAPQPAGVPPFRSSGPVPEGAIGYLALLALIAFVFTFWRADASPREREESVRSCGPRVTGHFEMAGDDSQRGANVMRVLVEPALLDIGSFTGVALGGRRRDRRRANGDDGRCTRDGRVRARSGAGAAIPGAPECRRTDRVAAARSVCEPRSAEGPPRVTTPPASQLLLI